MKKPLKYLCGQAFYFLNGFCMKILRINSPFRKSLNNILEIFVPDNNIKEVNNK